MPSQLKFHESKARFKGFSGPIGSGKSQALCQEALRLALENAGRTGLIGAPTYPMLRDATQRAFIEILERNGTEYEHNKSENTFVLADTKSKILFRAVDDFERLRGTNLAWFGIDELTYAPEEAWLRLEGRLRDPKARRLCGFGVWTPKGFDWVHRRFVGNKIKGYDLVIALPPTKNRHVLERIPDYYERLKSSYSELFYRQEVLGEYLNVTSGLVYDAFDRQQNLREMDLDPRLALLWTLDFNVEPMSSLIIQIEGREVRVLDEIVISRGTTWQACEEFVRRLTAQPWRVRVYGDASGQRMQTSGLNDYEMIRQHLRKEAIAPPEFRVAASNPSVRDRVMLANSKLRSASDDVELYIDPKCRELIRDLEEVTYKPGTYVIDKERDPKRTHLSDALGYLLWQECGPHPLIGEQPHRLF